MIVGGTVAGYAVAHLYTWRSPSASGWLVLVLMTGLACVGFADDYIKIFRQRSSGLRASIKLGGQAVVAIVFGAARHAASPAPDGRTPASQAISFVRDSPLGPARRPLRRVGLPHGRRHLERREPRRRARRARHRCLRRWCSAAYVVIGVWQYGNSCSTNLAAQVLRGPRPARPRRRRGGRGRCLLRVPVVERLAGPDLHGGHRIAVARRPLAGLAILSRTELLLVILGGLFVVITMSVILQVGLVQAHRAGACSSWPRCSTTSR